ncbi:S-layer homology domain-containing protein [Leptolyngbya sp. PCC 6406]|uniref:S-layer homology domain-containing protein n=1 Tax=Leptolyngbya sp. PCC 6406 TaxID=1173264 RepID=UPI0012DE1E6E
MPVFPLLQASPFHPRANETLFCDILVVGDTLAAYTATLAILQLGGRVCWVKPSAGAQIESESRLMGPETMVADGLPWDCAVSRSQLQFWQQQAQRQSPGQGSHSLRHRENSSEGLVVAHPSGELAAMDSRGDAMARGRSKTIASPLDLQGLMFISPAVPVRVLYSQTAGKRRVYQVVFREQRRGIPFRVHSGVTLDGTAGAALSTILTTDASIPESTHVNLTPDHRHPHRPRGARGTCFADSVGILRGEGRRSLAGAGLTPLQRRRQQPYRPMTLPLTAMIPIGVEGWLRMSQPATDPRWETFWQQPTVQWGLGESAGHAAVVATRTGQGFHTLSQDPRQRGQMQVQLARAGVPLFPFDDVGHDDPDFEAIQVLATVGIVCTMSDRDLHFRPRTPVTCAVVATALGRLFNWKTPQDTSLAAKVLGQVARSHWAWGYLAAAMVRDRPKGAIAAGSLKPMNAAPFRPNQVLSRRELATWVRSHLPEGVPLPPIVEDDAPARRRHLSRLLYGLWRSHWDIR